MNDINELLGHLSDADRENFIEAVSRVSDAFESQTSLAVDPEKIANLPAVREHRSFSLVCSCWRYRFESY